MSQVLHENEMRKNIVFIRGSAQVFHLYTKLARFEALKRPKICEVEIY